jgi:hypothetical protein
VTQRVNDEEPTPLQLRAAEAAGTRATIDRLASVRWIAEGGPRLARVVDHLMVRHHRLTHVEMTAAGYHPCINMDAWWAPL